MRYSVSVILVCILAIVMFSAGCAGDVNVKKKVGDFGSTFGASTEEQNALNWFTQKYGDPTVNSGQPPQFVEPLITSGLTSNLLPVDKITVFPVNGGSVYFWVFYQHFKNGAPITVTWTYLENGNVVSTVNEQTGDTYGRFIVEFQKPDSGWGKGRQRITISGSGASTSVDFTIGDSQQTTPLPYTGTGTTITSRTVTTLPRTVTTIPRTVTTVTTKTPTTPASSTQSVKFGNENGNGVSNNPTQPTVYTFATPVKITSITNYHWNGGKGTTSPGKISLRHSDGTVYGPWSTTGTPGQGGVPNAYWTANPSVTIKAGKYTVIDSDPSTWAQNAGSGNAGMTWGYSTPAVGGTTTTSSPASASGYIWVLKTAGLQGGSCNFDDPYTSSDKPSFDGSSGGSKSWSEMLASGTATSYTKFTDPNMAKVWDQKAEYSWAVPPNTLIPGGTVERRGTVQWLQRNPDPNWGGKVVMTIDQGQVYAYSYKVGEVGTLSYTTEVPSTSGGIGATWRMHYGMSGGASDGMCAAYLYVLQST